MKQFIDSYSLSLPSIPEGSTSRNCLRLIALDFDLTIYDHQNPKHTLNLQSWMQKMADHQVAVGLASGRGVEDLKRTLSEINWQWADPFPAFVVGYEGEIYKPDGEHWPGAKQFNLDRRQRVEQANKMLIPYFEEVVRWSLANNLELLHPISSSAGGVHVVFQTPEMAEIARKRLILLLEDYADISVFRNHHILGALPRNSAKGSALEELARLSGYERSQVLCIGDNLNDWSMLCENRGFKVAAVGNAAPMILENVTNAGGYVSNKNISHGIADIFNYYLSA